MKQGSFRAVRHLVFLLLFLSLTGFSVFAQQATVDMVSVILDPFDGNTTHEYIIGGRPYTFEFEWHLDASRFIANDFPRRTFVPSFPMALYGNNRDNRDLRSFGIWGSFDRQGYNWIDVYPVQAGAVVDENGEPIPFEIPIPGRAQVLDLWVWGSNMRLYLEAYVRDHTGIVHRLEMGELTYQGWKNLQVRIPNNIRQSRRILPSMASLRFVKFRIWSTPMERVDSFFVYFNQFKVLTDVFDPLFDGDELADPVRVLEFWQQD